MSLFELVGWLIIFGIIAFLYLKLAIKFRIVDVPNERSSHNKLVIRGGGLIIWIAILCSLTLSELESNFILAGSVLLGIVSFWDDIKTISPTSRIFFQFIAIFLLCYSIIPNPYSWQFCLAFFITVSAVNSYNFMDGINGLSGWYTLLAMATMYIMLPTTDFYWFPIIVALVVFIFFNSREKGNAVWFGGDIGSIVSGYFIMYWILKLMVESGQVSYIMILGVYGVDSGWTLLLRLYKGENVFSAHRYHIYQFLVNEKHLSHLRVTFYYILLQLLVNVSLFFQIKYKYFIDFYYLLSCFVFLSIFYYYFHTQRINHFNQPVDSKH